MSQQPPLKGKVALVTGASRGLGRAISLALAEAGADILLVSRQATDLWVVAEDIGRRGGHAGVFVADVLAQGVAEAAVEACVQRFGCVDILVNNAGVADESDSVHVTLEAWERVLRTNLTAPFLFCQAAGRRMIVSKRGKIINVASMFGLVGEPRLAAYCASKGGLIQLTRVLALEWARYNIQVNAIAPGYFVTDMTGAAVENPEIAKTMLRQIPARRFGRPEELGPLAVYLASSASDFMTGEVLVIDGGQTAR